MENPEQHKIQNGHDFSEALSLPSPVKLLGSRFFGLSIDGRFVSWNQINNLDHKAVDGQTL